ncbi:ribose-5-phosphate isomerase RpiA [Phenylobacterium sp. J426]|uniref:ribose-5-phosphate isomerase RpiA n=1 Tax=Phenylobacterium sp. J426 TaxID=2898439 RepID=UPI0021518E6F|nr:ribose-5-phosphate isomerase RpiA [Phenylobacterium sp. J426]MCR5876065.1 ribose-5-phosphate isomerase RpiA [Phenylobacterium sp. J426]
MSDAESQKRAAGEAAAALVESGMVVGLGTGSTAAWFVRALAARGLDVVGVPTSQATADLASSLGIKVADLGETREIDLTVDGADEIGPGLSLIKGGGAALLREKLVWEASKRCVVIADAAKVVGTLGRFALPIEVVAFGHRTTSLRICDVLAEFDIGIGPRLRERDGQPVRTDGGNLIYDAACGRIEEPAALAAALKSVTGVVDHGLFLDLAEQALIGTADGVRTLEP